MLTRLTFDAAIDAFPVWTSDGRRVIFSSDRNGARNLFWQPADGAGAVERLTDSPNSQYATDVSSDGQRLIMSEVAPKTRDDVIEIRLDGTRRVTPLVQSSFAERNGVVSPNGRWLAYETNDSGRFEISVRPFPDVNNGQWRVSTAGGTRPLGAPDGQELVYVSPAGALMSVVVARGPSWPLVSAAIDLMYRIHEGFRFDSTATTVTTPVTRVLSERRGVCQDFAHLQIACLRWLGLPARYVSGYLLTDPPPGQSRLIGADASHGWVSVWCPIQGWIERDPTNAVLPGLRHVTLAWGRDYGDVSPLRGVVLGAAITSCMSVSVSCPSTGQSSASDID